MNTTRNYLKTVLFLFVPFLWVQFLSKHPQWIETYYATGMYPFLSSSLRFLFGWIPFAIGEIFIVFLLGTILYKGVQFLRSKQKNWHAAVQKTGTFIAVLYTLFYLFWGMNYFREPLRVHLGYQASTYTISSLENTTLKIRDALVKTQLLITKDSAQTVVVPYSKKILHQKARNGYEQLAKKHPRFSYRFTAVKESIFSFIQNYTGTAGYFNPLTGGAQINTHIPLTGYPSTVCHEMAHQLGYAAENEANFIGFLAATANEDLYFKYAGYRMAFAYSISEMRKRAPEKAAAIWRTIPVGIITDFQQSNAFWKQYQNPVEPLVKKGYNAYLKANKQTRGIASYSYVVDLLIQYFETLPTATVTKIPTV